MKKSFANAVAAGLFAVGITAAVNFLAFQHPKRWDVTRARLFTLSDKTVKVLNNLKEPVSITVFYQPTHSLYKRVADLLREFEEKGGRRLQIEYVYPEKDPARTQQLAKQLKVELFNTVVVHRGEKIQQISDSALVDYDYTELEPGLPPKIKAFKGEEALTSAVLSVTEGKQPKVYFLTGHGEKEIDSFTQEGIAALRLLLEKNNMIAEKWLLMAKKEIPKDCDLLIVCGPTKPVPPDEIAQIKNYVEQGGALWLMIDPLTEPQLEPLLSEWGVEAGRNIVVDHSTGVPYISAANLFVSTYSNHAAARGMTGVATLFVMVRSVAAVPAKPGNENKNWRVLPLALTTPEGWGETKIMSQTFVFQEGEDVKGPVPVAVAVEPAAGAPAAKGRAVVIGDSEFCTNTQLTNVGNADFSTNLVQWLLQRESLISLPAKTPEQIQLHLSSGTLSRFFWSTVFGMPALSLLLGFCVFLRRR